MSSHPYLVTGASSGIGKAVVVRLLHEGRHVIALDRVECPVPGVETHLVDLANPESIEAALALVQDTLAGVANVAGVPGTLDAHTVLAVNLCGAKHVAESLVDRLEPGAAVVNVSSLAAHRCLMNQSAIDAIANADDIDEVDAWINEHRLDGSAAYDASKRALNQFTTQLAARLTPLGRRALTVSPGPIETPILGDFKASMGVDAIAQAEAFVGRHGRPEEIAAVIAFALSPGATWMNGIDIPVDGGLGAIRATAATQGGSR